jgi:hypothetical protein
MTYDLSVEISGSHGGEYEDDKFWDIMPCSLVEVDRRFGDAKVSIISAVIEAVRTSETSVYFHEITQHYIPKSCHLHIHRIFKEAILIIIAR